MKQMTNRQKQAQKTREKICACASELFSDKLYENVKIDDICKKAGISVGTFYYYFPTKESLVKEAFHSREDLVQDKWGQYQQTTPLKDISSLARIQAEVTQLHTPFSSAQFYRFHLTIMPSRLLQPDRFFYSTCLQLVERAVAIDELSGNPRTITEDLICMLNGAHLKWFTNDGNYDLCEHTERLVRMALDYYRP